MPSVVTVREAVRRAKAEGLPVSEYALRAWIRTGAIPVRNVGSKALIYYPHLVRFLQCVDGADNLADASMGVPGIRRADM